MVRITLYDPQVSAEAYSRRRAAERPFDSPVAEGLGRLGRALMARRERGAPRNQDRTGALRVLAKLRKQELARLRAELKPGAPDPRGSGRRFLTGHVKRRDAVLRALAERNPRSAQLAADGAATLTEGLARRAAVYEAANIGEALAADIDAALADAVEAVRADPTQGAAAQEEFRASLAALAEHGADEAAVATLIAAADRKIAGAAFEGRVAEDPEAARAELAAGAFGDGLSADEVEARMAKADREIKARRRHAESTARSAEDAFLAEFRQFEQLLSAGEAAGHELFSDDAIRARLPPGPAERLIGRRDRAEARGGAFREIALLSEREIAERLSEADAEETGHLVWARDRRRRLIGQDPASFVLRDPIVRAAHRRWQRARTEGDRDAAAAAGAAWANAARALQRRLGISGAEHRVLTTGIAIEWVRETEPPDGPDAAALGATLRDQFGAHWRVVLADLARAGLSEQVAIIAALDRPDQQPAARRLAASVGTPTSALRDSAGGAAETVDRLLASPTDGAATAPGADGIGADAGLWELVLRRAYGLAAEGLAPGRAVRRAIEDLWAPDSSETAGLHGPPLAAPAG